MEKNEFKPESAENMGFCKDESLSSRLDKEALDVVKLLISKGLKIATAESCTGGLVSQLITSVGGASEIFELGLCTYSNRFKHKLLDVPEEELDKYGAVSAQVAISMAKGLKKLSGADITVSVTGIAGPSGGTKEKPVGTVYMGYCFGDRCESKLLRLWELEDKSRIGIRMNTALAVLEKIKNIANGNFSD